MGLGGQIEESHKEIRDGKEITVIDKIRLTHIALIKPEYSVYPAEIQKAILEQEKLINEVCGINKKEK
jgi:hypothetical protein